MPYIDIASEHQELIQKFVRQRLELIKRNLHKIIQLHTENSLSVKQSRRLICDFINGTKDFADIDDITNYDGIDKQFLRNFHKTNYHVLSIADYVQICATKTSVELLYNFLDLYVPVVKSLTKHVSFNIHHLLGETSDPVDMDKIFEKQLHESMQAIEQRTRLYQDVHAIAQQHPEIVAEGLLLYFNQQSQIIYCSERCLRVLGYKINNLVGSSFISLCDFADVKQLNGYMKNQVISIKIKILGRDEKKHQVMVCRCNGLNFVFLCP